MRLGNETRLLQRLLRRSSPTAQRPLTGPDFFIVEKPMRRTSFEETNQIVNSMLIGLAGVVGSYFSVLFWIAIFWAGVRLFQGLISWPANRKVRLIGLAFAAYFGSGALSGLWNFDGVNTFLAMGAVLPFLGFLPVYARLSLSTRQGVLRSTEIGVLAGCLGTFGFAVWQTLVEDRDRAEGMAGNPGTFALITAVLYGLAMVTALRRDQPKPALAFLAVLAAAGALILSGMRTLWPMLLMAPIIPTAIYFSDIKQSRRMPTALAFLAGLLVIVPLAFKPVEARLDAFAEDYQHVFAASDYNNSIGHRVLIWANGLQRVAEEPILGHGSTSASVQMNIGSGSATTLTFSHYHNFVLTALVETGIVGLLATLFMMIAPIVLAYREKRDCLGNFGFSMMIAVVLAYTLSGTLNIMLGHDILDALFIYSMIVSSFLVWGNDRKFGEESASFDRRAGPGEPREPAPLPSAA